MINAEGDYRSVAPLFDDEPGLQDLLSSIDTARLAAALQQAVGEEIGIVDCSGRVVLGHTVEGGQRAPLRGELEPLGYVVAAGISEPMLNAMAALVELVLRGALRYQMASRLHVQVVQGDYERLAEQNTALTASERRYRELAASLEQRVQRQVQEIEAGNRRLYQSEKVAAVGRLAAGMAHEINNPLGFIGSNLRTAAGYLDTVGQHLITSDDTRKNTELAPLMSDFRELLTECEDGVRRIARIVADLKEYSNVDHAEFELRSVDVIVGATCGIAERQSGRPGGIDMQLGDTPPIPCQPAHLAQVILNLVTNALQAVGDGGGVGVRTALRAGEVVIEVVDNGCGIAPEIVPHIFDPFFTTRQVGSGTGLGLSVCRDIVHAHKGRIDVESNPGVGSVFRVFLPISEHQPHSSGIAP